MSFDLTDSGNLFRIFEHDKNVYKIPLFLVVDGIDELEGDLSKILELASGISDFAIQYRNEGMLEIVISVREVTWNKYVKHEFAGQKPGWLLALPGYSLESGSNNVPEFSSSEVRKLLSMENDGDGGTIVYECIHWEMRQLIRVPLNFHFFLTMIQSLPGISDLSSDRLLQEYLNALILKSRFSDEKTDLVSDSILLEEKSLSGLGKNMHQ